MAAVYYSSPVGTLTITEEDGFITGIRIGKLEADEEETLLLSQAVQELDEYFEGRRREFDLPLKPHGTAFQKRVWEALRRIPYGKTASYRDIAKAVENPRGFRAVGNANGKNPIVIVVPCHRVIAADGSLGGYTGGLDIKRFLLEHENKWKNS